MLSRCTCCCAPMSRSCRFVQDVAILEGAHETSLPHLHLGRRSPECHLLNYVQLDDLADQRYARDIGRLQTSLAWSPDVKADVAVPVRVA